MVKAEIYKGIEFVRISKLPEEQATQILSWNKLKKISIQAEEGIWRDCVQYKLYKHWYENKYHPMPAITITTSNEQQQVPKRTFAFGLSRIFHSLLSKN